MVYSSPLYVSLAQQGMTTLYLETLGTAVSVRNIYDTVYVDAIGPYPFTEITTNCSREEVLKELNAAGLVSLTLVANPIVNDQQNLERYFDSVKPYKDHFLADYQKPMVLSKHHRYEVRKSLRVCRVEVIELAEYLNEWVELYKNLQKRHQFGERHQFSREYFAMLASLQELTAIGAFINGQLVSCSLWLMSHGYVYNHLGASSQAGYHSSAAYAIYDYAIKHFRNCRGIDLGGVSDTSEGTQSLGFFKRGFANNTISACLCGLIANPTVYQKLLGQVTTAESFGGGTYFPEYRAPED